MLSMSTPLEKRGDNPLFQINNRHTRCLFISSHELLIKIILINSDKDFMKKTD